MQMHCATPGATAATANTRRVCVGLRPTPRWGLRPQTPNFSRFALDFLQSFKPTHPPIGAPANKYAHACTIISSTETKEERGESNRIEFFFLGGGVVGGGLG